MTNKCKGIMGFIFGHEVQVITEIRDYGVKSEGMPLDSMMETILKHPTMSGVELERICSDLFNAATACTTIPIGVHCTRCGQIEKIQDLRNSNGNK